MKSYVSLTVLTLGLNYVYRKSRQQDGGLTINGLYSHSSIGVQTVGIFVIPEQSEKLSEPSGVQESLQVLLLSSFSSPHSLQWFRKIALPLQDQKSPSLIC